MEISEVGAIHSWQDEEKTSHRMVLSKACGQEPIISSHIFS
jgi:hypothetical protein